MSSLLTEMLGKAVVENMSEMDDENRIRMLEGIDNMHVAAFVTWLGIEIFEHEDHPSDCPFKNPEKVVNLYIEHFSDSLHKSIAATCDANGVQYRPDPNKDADAALKEQTE